MKSMTGKERGIAALKGLPFDKAPVIPIVGQAGGTMMGKTIYQHAHDPKLLAQCQVDLARKCGYDGIYIAADTWVNAEAIGFPWVEHPQDDPAGGMGTWIKTPEDLEKLRFPDPTKDGRWPLMCQAVRHAVEMAGDELLIVANFDQSPFSLACQLRDINEFMVDTLQNKEFAHKVLEYCAKAISQYAIALSKAGAHVLNTGDSSAGGSLIGGEWYEEFGFPYEKIVFDNIRKEVDTLITLHICGDSRTCIDKMLESGADGIEIDEFMDMNIAREKCADKMTVIGNVDPVFPILQGTPEQVKEKCRVCLDAFKDSNRFILSSGCAIAPATKPENLTAMVEVRDEYYK